MVSEMPDDTRDIAIEVRTKVERLEASVEAMEKDLKRLLTFVDQGSGIVGALRLLGFSTLGGAVALIADNWASLKSFFGK
jgi:hypothetical protein